MPYNFRKLPNQDLYRVYNTETKEIHSYGTTLENAKKQIKLLNMIDAGVPLKKGKGIDNPELYEEAKKIADDTYKKPSAYKSGFIVKKYKELGGTYSGKKENKGINRWFKEEWKDVGKKDYPVYRPTKRITKDTPLTVQEISPSNLKKQIDLKQIIKGDANLPPFLSDLKKEGKGLLSKNKILSNNRMANPWIEYVKSYAAKNGMSYRDALRCPKCKAGYKKGGKVGMGVVDEIGNQDLLAEMYNDSELGANAGKKYISL